MQTAQTMDAPWGDAWGRPSPLRLAVPLALFGAARMARRRGRRGPSPLRFVLPLALVGGARMALVARGRQRGGPFAREDDEGSNPFGGNPFGGRPFGGFPFGGFPFGGPRGPFDRGPRAKRGDIRAGILALLAEEPRNGYQIIQELGQRSHGAWRPSPGSVYPALQQLEDEGLIRAEEADGKRTFHLTDTGRAYVAAHGEEIAAPWDAIAGNVHDEMHEVGGLVMQVGAAAMQVLHTGNARQVAEARKILTGARRSLYRLLAEDDEEAESDDAGRG
ncbi:MAG TPA: PadR family transcriptional regulator [Thermomicrobiales bacterium]|nr:PadR family transcriptional regulator [Thermomicrobiales bacterium]